MKRITIAALILGSLAGCNQQSVPEAKIAAYKRWNFTRAQILYGVAKELYKSGQLKQARTKLRNSLSLDENYTPSGMLLAKVYIEQGHYGLAMGELDKIRNRKGESSSLLYLIGIAREKQGRLDDALLAYRRAHALDPKNIATITAISEVLVALNRIREAQVYLESYLPLAGDDPTIFELAGRIAVMRSQWDQAQDYYQRALDLAPKNIYYRRGLAKSQFFAGRYRPALQTLKDLVRIEGDKSPVWACAMLGDCYLALGKARDARDTYRTAVQRKPDDAGLWTNLAKAAMALRDAPRAIMSARKALAISPGRLDATMLLAYALIRNRQAVRAIGVLQNAVARHEKNAMVRCLLGRAYAATGNLDEARQCYNDAVRVDPGNKLARDLLTEINVRKLSKAG